MVKRSEVKRTFQVTTAKVESSEFPSPHSGVCASSGTHHTNQRTVQYLLKVLQKRLLLRASLPLDAPS